MPVVECPHLANTTVELNTLTINKVIIIIIIILKRLELFSTYFFITYIRNGLLEIC